MTAASAGSNAQIVLLISEVQLLWYELTAKAVKRTIGGGERFELLLLKDPKTDEQTALAAAQRDSVEGAIVLLSSWTLRQVIRETLNRRGAWYLNPHACLFAPNHKEVDRYISGIGSQFLRPKLRDSAKWLCSAIQYKAAPYPKFALKETDPEPALIELDSSDLLTFEPSKIGEESRALAYAWLCTGEIHFGDLPLSAWKDARLEKEGAIIEALDDLSENKHFNAESLNRFFNENHPFHSHYANFLAPVGESTVEEAHWLSIIYYWKLSTFGWTWENGHGCFFANAIFDDDPLRNFLPILETNSAFHDLNHFELAIWSLLAGKGLNLTAVKIEDGQKIGEGPARSAHATMHAFAGNIEHAISLIRSTDLPAAELARDYSKDGGTLMLVEFARLVTKQPLFQSYYSHFAKSSPNYFNLISKGIRKSLSLQPASAKTTKALKKWAEQFK